uniref:Putative peptidase n=1 Tax=viral metagenome TaxID=1070528 RepID=A0A6M3KXE7_9ZZZZ
MPKFFKKDELMCPCCGECCMDFDFLDKLITARSFANIPFVLTSAYRCKKHNEEVGGSPTSSHLIGKAVDIAIRDNHERFIIKRSLFEAGFLRIEDGGTWIHVDSDEEKDQEVEWRP